MRMRGRRFQALRVSPFFFPTDTPFTFSLTSFSPPGRFVVIPDADNFPTAPVLDAPSPHYLPSGPPLLLHLSSGFMALPEVAGLYKLRSILACAFAPPWSNLVFPFLISVYLSPFFVFCISALKWAPASEKFSGRPVEPCSSFIGAPFPPFSALIFPLHFFSFGDVPPLVFLSFFFPVIPYTHPRVFFPFC